MNATILLRRRGLLQSRFFLLASALIFAPSIIKAQINGLMWSTNFGTRVFAVDAQQNIYTHSGGTVVKISSAGVPLQTNSICPVPPAYALRDASGNYYFTGTFDGTQNFGGITLVGGWTNWPGPGQWTPGYPTCFLTKYDSGGVLQWAASYGKQAYVNKATDLMSAADGSVVAAYANNQYSGLRDFTTTGSNRWEIQIGDLDNTSPVGQIRVAKDSSTNAYFLIQDPTTIYLRRGWFDTNGNYVLLSSLPNLMWNGTGTNSKPAVCDETGAVFAGRETGAGTMVIAKYLMAGGIVWTNSMPSNLPWTLAGDPAGLVYTTDTNGVLYLHDCDGNLIGSTNLGSVIDSMLIEEGVSLLNFQNGAVGRLATDLIPGAPTISVQPVGLTRFVGDGFQLSVIASGTPPLKYFWQKDGTNIAGAITPTYSIASSTVGDNGDYTVLITNRGGSITSAPALVRIKSVQLYLGSQLLTNGTYFFASPPTLSIHSAFGGGSSFYTLDGSPPSFASTFYSGSFVVSQNSTVRAIGYSSDFFKSEEADAVNVVLPTRHNLSVTTSGGGIVTTNLNPGPADANCVAPPSGAVGWWRAESTAADSIGGHTGTAYGGTTYSNGIVGQSFHFDAGNKSHVRVPDAADLHFTSAMTVEAWVLPEGGATLVSKWDAVGARSQCSFRLSLGNLGRAYFQISPDGTGGATSAVYPPYCMSATTIPGGTWTHLAGTFDGSTLRIYVNGILDGQTSFTGTIYSGNNDLAICGMVGGTYLGNVFDEYNGFIDEVAVYNRALSPAEIQAIYHAGSNGKCTSPPFTGGNYVESNTVTLTALPFYGNTFMHWLGDAVGTNSTINVSMNQDKSVFAVFGTALASTVAGSGHIQLSPTSGPYAYGSIVQLTGIPDPGNYFGFWGNAATGNTNPLYFTIAAPTQTISSIFGALPTGQAALTVVTSGRGRVNANTRANAYPTNQSVSLAAVPDSGASFVNWSGDASGTQNPLTVGMTQSKLIQANFTGQPALRANRGGAEGLTPNGFRLTVVGDPPCVYQILGSTNLTAWQPLGAVTNEIGEVQFTDTNAAAFRARFYKVSP